ncbi:unnamed protein product [Acanthoscelides obtectus]|uniref:Uncharacterized protein n=1 Tax=Acanthoscelides obtectus TaxID=200917 RepID=A0A9P0PXQ5_ACAOB|nr:unnamed protein product [Acanthoscelides obtectus]CAK1643643.1 hypothetical protein AOBTE_LOCUS13618 [Acanthoscelides obtectus]
MGGVDLSDQMSSLYEIDRKSQKWWRKTFYKLLRPFQPYDVYQFLTNEVLYKIVVKTKRYASHLIQNK